MRDFTAIVKNRQPSTGLFFAQAGFTKDAVATAFQQSDECPILLLRLSCDFEGYARKLKQSADGSVSDSAPVLQAALESISPNRAWLKAQGNYAFVAAINSNDASGANKGPPAIHCRVPFGAPSSSPAGDGDDDDNNNEALVEIRYHTSLRLR